MKTLVERIKDFKSVVCRYGAKTPEDFIYKNTLFGQWQKIKGVDIKLTVDQANGQWKDNVGLVTTILSKDDVDIKNAAAIVCGPPVMMKFAMLRLLEFGIKLLMRAKLKKTLDSLFKIFVKRASDIRSGLMKKKSSAKSMVDNEKYDSEIRKVNNIIQEMSYLYKSQGKE